MDTDQFKEIRSKWLEKKDLIRADRTLLPEDGRWDTARMKRFLKADELAVIKGAILLEETINTPPSNKLEATLLDELTFDIPTGVIEFLCNVVQQWKKKNCVTEKQILGLRKTIVHNHKYVVFLTHFANEASKVTEDNDENETN